MLRKTLAPGVTLSFRPGDKCIITLESDGNGYTLREKEAVEAASRVANAVTLAAWSVPEKITHDGRQLPEELRARLAAEAERDLASLVGAEARTAGSVVGRDTETTQQRHGDPFEFLADAPAFGRALGEDVYAADGFPTWTERLMQEPAYRALLDRLLEVAGQPADARRKRLERHREGVGPDPDLAAALETEHRARSATPEERVLLGEVYLRASKCQRLALQALAEGDGVAEAGARAGLSRDWLRDLRRHRLRG